MNRPYLIVFPLSFNRQIRSKFVVVVVVAYFARMRMQFHMILIYYTLQLSYAYWTRSYYITSTLIGRIFVADRDLTSGVIFRKSISQLINSYFEHIDEYAFIILATIFSQRFRTRNY